MNFLIDDIVEELNSFDEKKEFVIKEDRKIRRISGTGISNLIKNKEIQPHLDKLASIVPTVITEMQYLSHVTSWNIVSQGLEEYTEFIILNDIIKGNSITSADFLGIPKWIWLLGLCDVPGELRRIILSLIIEGKIDDAKRFYQWIEEIYENLSGLEFSKSLIPNLRRKIDVLRMVMDKTQSDIAHAIINERLKGDNK
ncbi:MAG: hypothetical protein OEY49_09670 [Candidatus Heimdallarchaeota archaeon]|nr:hypothetical protein [Candidatus Heimdallarchaeota archaeon]